MILWSFRPFHCPTSGPGEHVTFAQMHMAPFASTTQELAASQGLRISMTFAKSACSKNTCSCLFGFFCYAFSSLQDIARLQSRGRKKKEKWLHSLCSPSLPPPLWCIPPDVRVDRAIFKQAQDLWRSFFVCSASAISQVYCHWERQLCLSCRAHLALCITPYVFIKCRTAQHCIISETKHALSVQCFLYQTCSESSEFNLEAPFPSARPDIHMTINLHVLFHPLPSILAHTALCIDHLHICWLHSTILFLSPLYLVLQNDGKSQRCAIGPPEMPVIWK